MRAPVCLQRPELLEVRYVLLVVAPSFGSPEVGGQLDVDARLLEPGYLVVHAVQAFRIEFDEAVLGLDAGPARSVGVFVQAHRVDAVLAIECRARRSASSFSGAHAL